MNLLPFKAEDALELALQPSQLAEFTWHDRRKAAQAFADAGQAFTLRDDAGAAVFCGGAVERHPGYVNLWGMFALGKRMGALKLRTMSRRFIARLPHARVDAFVPDSPKARRWAELIGLTYETRLQGAAADGGDLLVYRRIEE